MTPLPVAENFDALNARFLDACAKRGKAVLRGHIGVSGISCVVPLYNAIAIIAVEMCPKGNAITAFRNFEALALGQLGHFPKRADGKIEC